MYINELYSNNTEPKEYSLEWYKHKINTVIPEYEDLEDIHKMKLAYDIYHDDLRALQKEFEEFCNPLGERDNLTKVKPYPVLHNKINILKGEMYKREDDLSIVNLYQSLLKEKNEQIRENIIAKLQPQIQEFIEKIQQNVAPEELDRYVEEEQKRIQPEDIDVKNFKHDWEIFWEKAIRLCKHQQGIKHKKVEALEDVYCADRFFVYSGWRYGKPVLELRNTLFTAFSKASNEHYVNKGDYVAYRKARTYDEIYQDYQHLLTDEELERIRRKYGSSIYDQSNDVMSGKAKPLRDLIDESIFSRVEDHPNLHYRPDKHIGHSQSRAGTDFRDNLIWETHFEFRHFEDIIFLHYHDDYNEEIILTLPADFEIPKDANKVKFVNRFGNKSVKYIWTEDDVEYQAEKLKIPIKHEVVRLEGDIYPIYRRVPHQQIDVNDPYGSFNLSTFGCVFTARNARSISPLQRVLPLYMQYLYVKDLENRELRKYQGFIQNVDVDQIPKQLGQDIDGNDLRDPIKVWLTYRKMEGLNLYSGSQTTNNMPPPPTRSPGSTAHIIGTAAEIFNLQQFLGLIENEIGMALGVPPQREAQFSANSNASDNRQALLQSYHITEPYFAKIDEVWRQAIKDWLHNFKTYCKNELDRNPNNLLFSYVLPDGTQELFEVTPYMLQAGDIDLHLKSSSNRKEYNEYMLQYSQAFAQNAGEGVEAVSEIISAITAGNSPEETHRLIQIRAKQLREFQQQMAEQEKQAQLELLDKQEQMKVAEHQRELEKIELEERLKGEYDLQKESLKKSE